MTYSIYVTLDKSLKKDYCVLTVSPYDDEMLDLKVFTNGEEKIDFQKLNYISPNKGYFTDFIYYFSYGRNIISNAKVLSITNRTDKIKNTKQDNRDIMKLINVNGWANKKLFIDIGAINLSNEDIDLLKPLKKCKDGMVTFGDTNIYHSIDEIETLHEITNEIIRKINKQDFSPLERLLYSYDLVRTNFAVNPILEKKLEKILSYYQEPSFCYALVYNEVLNKLGIRNAHAFGEFSNAGRRAFNIAYVKDDVYDIEGVYYFDIGDNSKQKVNNSLMLIPEDNNIQHELINNYASFAKTKNYMTYSGCLDHDYVFGDFDEEFMSVYDYALEKSGINGVYRLRGLINNVSNFVDGTQVIDSFKGIHSDEELDQIRLDTERLVELFSKDIEARDFLEILFNVRKAEYIENKELFPLNIETLKECMEKSDFTYSEIDLVIDDDEDEDKVNEKVREIFDTCFEDSIDKTHIEERIRKLKLSLNKDINKPKKDDNN